MLRRSPSAGQSPKRTPAVAVLAIGLLLVAPMTSPGLAEEAEQQAAAAAPNSRLEGKITGTSGRPAGGVSVLVYHLATEQVFNTTTDARGGFRLTELPYGYFDVAVRSSDGLFVADQVANVAPDGKTVLRLTLVLTPEDDADRLRPFPGDDEPAIGVATMTKKSSSGAFWSSPKGIGIIAGLGGVALIVAASGGSDSSSVTPSPVVP
jgi:hypothetical protein